ncbi:MAG: heavy-metal-associated domain-containing protein [Cyanobacteria bacterium P01_D01_bin.115]
MALNLKVPSIVCDGCAETVTKAIHTVDANAQVNVDVSGKTVTAETNAAESVVREAITASGHTVD